MLRTGDILDLGPLETQLIIKKTAPVRVYNKHQPAAAPPAPVMRLFGWVGQLLGYRV